MTWIPNCQAWGTPQGPRGAVVLLKLARPSLRSCGGDDRQTRCGVSVVESATLIAMV